MAMAQRVTLPVLVAHGMQHNAGRKGWRLNIDAAKVVTTIWKLAKARDELGHWPTQVEYAEHWKRSERSAQREWALFKQAFPTLEPEDLAKQLYADMREQLDDSSVAFSYEP